MHQVAAVVLAFVTMSGTAQAAALCGAPDSTHTSVCAIDPGIDRLALCNDGTLPVFSFRPGSGQGLTRWLIWLEGGGQCEDVTSCVKRAELAPALLTSDGFSPKPGDGLLSSDARVSPILHDVNVVVVHYCSSDDWAGGRQSLVPFDPADPSSWHFQGRRIAVAAVSSIRQIAPGFAAATHILLGGSSAGGVGITVTANDILPVLPAAPDIRVVNDAGFALNVGQYDPGAPSPYVYPGRHDAFDALFSAGMALWNGRGDAKCSAAARSQQDRIDCFSATVFQTGYIGVPAFVAESQLDTAQLSDEICPAQYGMCPVAHNPKSTEGVYSAAFGASMARALIGAGTPAAYAVYSPNAYMHTILSNAKEFGVRYTFPNGKLSAQDVFDQWLRVAGGRRMVEIGNGPGVTATSRRP